MEKEKESPNSISGTLLKIAVIFIFGIITVIACATIARLVLDNIKTYRIEVPPEIIREFNVKWEDAHPIYKCDNGTYELWFLGLKKESTSDSFEDAMEEKKGMVSRMVRHEIRLYKNGRIKSKTETPCGERVN